MQRQVTRSGPQIRYFRAGRSSSVSTMAEHPEHSVNYTRNTQRMRQEPLTTADDTRNFEQRLEEIEAIVADLESGKLSLDEMLLRYESGMKLIDACQQRLATAELKVTEIAEATSLNSHASDEWPDSDDE